MIEKHWTDDRGHVWRMDGDGIDFFGLEANFHNGPICVSCGYSFCHHCENGPTEDCSKPAIEGECFDASKAKLLTVSASAK